MPYTIHGWEIPLVPQHSDRSRARCMGETLCPTCVAGKFLIDLTVLAVGGDNEQFAGVIESARPSVREDARLKALDTVSDLADVLRDALGGEPEDDTEAVALPADLIEAVRQRAAARDAETAIREIVTRWVSATPADNII